MLNKDYEDEMLNQVQSGSDIDPSIAAFDVSSVLLLKMIEPSPEGDMRKWIAWFDGLSEYLSIF